MAVISVLVISPGKCLVPWTVFQADPDLSFVSLFYKISSGGVHVISPSPELAEAEIDRVFVGTSKKSVSG